MDEQTARRDLLRICHLLYERSYVVSSDGNVSVQLDDGRILATPTMTCKGRMTEDLIAVTDLEGRSLNNQKASSELAMHLLIYRERPDVKAVCHAHPPHGTAFAVAGLAAICTKRISLVRRGIGRLVPIHHQQTDLERSR